tara:strand:- start:1166 stop:1324 length:159 start_codon:yes stop_codon:yes gene_type:complete
MRITKHYKLYQEELEWQAFCRWLGLSQSDDIDDVENVDQLFEEFRKESEQFQ